MRAAARLAACLAGVALASASAAAERDPYEAVIEVARRALPAVVEIQAASPPGTPASEILGPDRRGTGTLIDPSGVILTSDHVVVGGQEIRVTLTDGRRMPGRVVAHDTHTDLAIVRVEGRDLPHLPLGRSAGVRLGEGVVIVGNRMGPHREVTLGTVNFIGPFVGYWEFMLDRTLHTNALVQLGYSGGPLLNLRGEVVGVVSFLLPTAPGPEGVIIPVEEAARLREEMDSPPEGRLRARRAWLGTIVRDGEGGVRVQRVTPGGPASRTDLRAKDLITHVDAAPVDGVVSYYREIWRHAPGEKIRLTLKREGEARTVVVESMDRDRFYASPAPRP